MDTIAFITMIIGLSVTTLLVAPQPIFMTESRTDPRRRQLSLIQIEIRCVWVLVFLVAFGWSGAEAAPYFDDTVKDQWFTGPLVAPSPALTTAGAVAIEPYAIYTSNTGAYDGNWQYHSAPNNLNQVQSETLLKYGITDQLTIQALPAFASSWNDQTTSSGVGVDDLPVELEYRFNKGNRRTGLPSVTVDVGMTFPTGEYDRLGNPLDGLGSGAFVLKEGLLLQSLFDTWGNHPMRLRLWGAAYEPLANVSVHDVSVYGTSLGFRGEAAAGFTADWGLGVEYGLNQRWVLALDLVQNYADGYRLNGIDAGGNSVHTNEPNSTYVALAPAVEYNFSSRVGLIIGLELSVAGRNTPSYVAPQIALTAGF